MASIQFFWSHNGKGHPDNYLFAATQNSEQMEVASLKKKVDFSNLIKLLKT